MPSVLGTMLNVGIFATAEAAITIQSYARSIARVVTPKSPPASYSLIPPYWVIYTALLANPYGIQYLYVARMGGIYHP